jgi:predicted ATPase
MRFSASPFVESRRSELNDQRPLRTNESLAQRCIERAVGNPLFLEQLLLSVRNGASETIPDSIKSLLLSRMDNLPDEDGRALQTASVLGQRFDPGCLCFMIDDQTYNYQKLIDHHLLRPEGTQYLFAHALIREGAYNLTHQAATPGIAPQSR